MAERAARIAAMLDRWDAEDVSGEREWDVEDLEPMKLPPAIGQRRQAQDVRLLLDTGVLGQVCHPRKYHDVRSWFRRAVREPSTSTT
jgi:hypothetical protein